MSGWVTRKNSISKKPHLQESARLLEETPSYAHESVKDAAKAWSATIDTSKFKDLEVFYRQGHHELSFELEGFQVTDKREEEISFSGERGSFKAIGQISQRDIEVDNDNFYIVEISGLNLDCIQSGIYEIGDWVELKISRLTVWD